MYRLQVKSHFDAAHYLTHYPGKCSRMHGHRWDVEVCIQGRELSEIGNMLIDFSVVKKLLKDRLELLDHYILNERLHEFDPTAEFLAEWLFEHFNTDLHNLMEGSTDIELVRVCIWESPGCCVKYSPDMKSVSE